MSNTYERVQMFVFYESLDMWHTGRPPMVLVDNSALNDHSAKEGGRADGPQTHTLGLCLTAYVPIIESTSVSFLARTGSLLSQVRWTVNLVS